MRVAAIQMTSGHDIDANLEAAGRFLADAARLGAVLAALPENFAFMGKDAGDKRAIAEPDGAGRIQNFLADTARRLKIWVLGGTVPLRQDSEGRVSASCLVYDAHGQRVARYDKMHLFDVDVPGKDSYRHRHAGATEVLVTSSRRWVLMNELRGGKEPSFEDQVKHLSPCDLLIVEGFKFAPIPKLEVWRAETGEGLLHPNDPHIVAVASDRKVETRLPQFDLNDADKIAAFIVAHLKLA